MGRNLGAYAIMGLGIHPKHQPNLFISDALYAHTLLVCAQRNGWRLVQEKRRKPSEFPLSTHVRPSSQQHQEAVILRSLEEGREIGSERKIVNSCMLLFLSRMIRQTRRRVVEVPRHVLKELKFKNINACSKTYMFQWNSAPSP